ncbi:MAG: NapC/NirT family cytochrome c [Chloroflexota bacterium]|nr:NapC/NirT family cytochrome c [Chloroflexota bacterium]
MTRNSSRAGRRASRAQRSQTSWLVRVRALRGWQRVAAGAIAVFGLVAVFLAAGGTAYAINLENQDAFCASCHTEPESKYLEQSLDKNTRNLAAFHTQKTVRCIDCHSGGGIFGRATGLTQGAQDLMAYQSGNYHAPAITLSKLGDDSCTKCHADTMTRRDFNNHFHLYLSEWQASDPNAAHCVDCHVAHPVGDPTQQFLTVKTVQTICQDCHNALGARG